MGTPILVQFEYHPRSEEAASIAENLHTALNDDPAVPGLRIPTLFTRDNNTDVVPEPRIAEEAERVLVVVLADNYLAAHDFDEPLDDGRTWADYFADLRNLCDHNENYRLMPVQLTRHKSQINSRLEDISFLPAWRCDSRQEQECFIARRITHLLLRRIQSTSPSLEDAPPVTIFLSHAKYDLEAEPYATKALLDHLTAEQPQGAWFDSGDIEAGSIFAKRIECGVKDAALLVILTDSYSSRSWCRREVLLAKHFQRPVVVVDALREREVRSFPYVGNVPVVRWKGDPLEIIDVLLREALRQSIAHEILHKCKQPNDVVSPAVPELLTLTKYKPNQIVLYPDPPLGEEELAVIEKTTISVETPLERHARKVDLSKKSLTVAISISEAEDISLYGLRLFHLDTALLEISRYLLISGIRLAYGGHLGSEGYTVKLADLLHDPTVEHLRGSPGDTKTPTRPQLVNYLAWPIPHNDEEKARLGSLTQVISCRRPRDIDETLDPNFTDPISSKVTTDSGIHRFAWARGLTTMRRHQIEDVNARIIIGGRLGLSSHPYLGCMPGVLEEIILSIEAQQPIYLIGAYGGCAHMVCEAFKGHRLAGLTWDYHRKIPQVEELRSIYSDRNITWNDYDSIFNSLRDGGFNVLHNGLQVEENQELAMTRSTERIVELILSGLQNIYGTTDYTGGTNG